MKKMFLAWRNCINNWFAASVSLAYMLTTLLSPLCYLLLYGCTSIESQTEQHGQDMQEFFAASYGL